MIKKSIWLAPILVLFLSLVSCQIFNEMRIKAESNLFRETTLSIEQGEIERAKTLLEEFSRKYPQSPKLAALNFLISKKLYQNKKNDEALFYISRGSGKEIDISIKGDFFETYGKIYTAKGNAYKGIINFLNALQYTPSEKKKKEINGFITDAIDKKATVGELEKIIGSFGSRFPSDEAILRLSKLKLYSGDELESIGLLEKFINSFPSHPKLPETKKLLQDVKKGLGYNKNLIGCILPLSGKYAKFGEWVKNGILTAINQKGGEVFGRQIDLIFKDSEGSPQKAADALRELAERYKPIAIIGPVRSFSVKACAKAVNKFKIPLISPTADDEDIANLSPYIFRNALTPKMQGEAMALYSINKLGMKNFAIIYPENFYGRNLNKYFTEKVNELGGNIIAEESYNPDENDFQMQALRIKEKQDAIAPIDGIYLPGFFDRVALIIPHLYFQGVQGIRFLGSNGWDSNTGGIDGTSKKIIDMVEERASLEGAVFTDGFYSDSKNPQVQEFVKAYKEAFDSNPNFYAAQSYDATCILINLLKSGTITREAVREGLASLRNFNGVSGVTTILPTGDSEKKLFFIRITNGDFEEINSE